MDFSPRSQPDSFAWKPPTDRLDLEADQSGWFDPHEERNRDRRRTRACLLAFSMLGAALLVATLTTALGLFSIFRQAPGLRLPESWQFAASTLIAWLSFVGTCLLWGRWRDRSWQFRSGMLVLMGFVDLILWSLDHAVDLGLSDQAVGHEWFRENLGHGLGWAELSLIAGLAAEVAAHLHVPRALDVARGVRSLSSIGGTVWLFLFFILTRWQAPIWPLRFRGLNRILQLSLLWLGEHVIFLICLVQTTALTLSATYACSLALRRMLYEDRNHDLLGLPSETAWDEYNKPRPPDSV